MPRWLLVWWFFEIYMEQEFARNIIESDMLNKKRDAIESSSILRNN